MNSKSSHQKPEKPIGKLSLGSSAKGQLLSHNPSHSSLAIGQSMGTLFTELTSAEALPQEILALGEDLQRYNESQLQYMDATRLENISCSHAVKKWAFERMQELKIPYEMKNRINTGSNRGKRGRACYLENTGPSGRLSSNRQLLPQARSHANRDGSPCGRDGINL